MHEVIYIGQKGKITKLMPFLSVSAFVTRLVLGADILRENVNISPKSRAVENTNEGECDMGGGEEVCAMDVNNRGIDQTRWFVPRGEAGFRKAKSFEHLYLGLKSKF